jgi:hypothetical protein
MEQAGGSIELTLGADEHARRVLPLGLRVERTDLSLDASTTDFVATDLNGDGTIDLALVGMTEGANAGSLSGGLLSVLYGNGDGTFIPPLTADIPTQPFSVKAVDINADGKKDLFTTGVGDSLSLFQNLSFDQTGPRTPILINPGPPTIDCPTPTDPRSLAVGDA